MTEKTRKQIEGIHNGRFGVEIEMYNITRQKAAKTAATFFGTGLYKYTGDEKGYCTWSAFDQQGREWLFQRDSSILAERDSERCELVTPLLHYSDLEFLQELVRQLRHAGARSNPEHFCGVHLHIHEEGHTPQSLLQDGGSGVPAAAQQQETLDHGRTCRLLVQRQHRKKQSLPPQPLHHGKLPQPL